MLGVVDPRGHPAWAAWGALALVLGEPAVVELLRQSKHASTWAKREPILVHRDAEVVLAAELLVERDAIALVLGGSNRDGAVRGGMRWGQVRWGGVKRERKRKKKKGREKKGWGEMRSDGM